MRSSWVLEILWSSRRSLWIRCTTCKLKRKLIEEGLKVDRVVTVRFLLGRFFQRRDSITGEPGDKWLMTVVTTCILSTSAAVYQEHLVIPSHRVEETREKLNYWICILHPRNCTRRYIRRPPRSRLRVNLPAKLFLNLPAALWRLSVTLSCA